MSTEGVIDGWIFCAFTVMVIIAFNYGSHIFLCKHFYNDDSAISVSQNALYTLPRLDKISIFIDIFLNTRRFLQIIDNKCIIFLEIILYYYGKFAIIFDKKPNV